LVDPNVKQNRHFTIPVFIPQRGCPFECLYCNQRAIAGRSVPPTEEEVHTIVAAHLATIPREGSVIELGFFGGNFTGISSKDQERYLTAAAFYLGKGAIDGIRVSTRPDYINEESLSLLKKFGVGTVELGAQSCDDGVLKAAGRGHTFAQVRAASGLVLRYGMRLGLQMMIGLPGDTREKSLETAERFVEMKAGFARIYPTLVVRGTGLEELYREGDYRPLTLDEAISWTKEIMLFFEDRGVPVIRVGLHSTEGFLAGETLVAGPFHPSLRELVQTEIWRDLLEEVVKDKKGDQIALTVAPESIHHAIGYAGKNRNFLKEIFSRVVIKASPVFSGKQYHVSFD
jgi:histone acetyltransferase (RNA polymerase elongator complex component)